jgi:2-iminoacetate synthase
MSFAKVLAQNDFAQFAGRRAFLRLLEPGADDAALEELAARSHAETVRQFGRTMRLFAPLYLSNECINNCKYCGFSRDNPILRVTLPVEQVVAEARHLAAEGFRNILLVAGEHPKFVSNGYLEACVRAVREQAGVPGVSLEVGPMEAAEYRPLVEAGAEGLVVYQETYHRPTYEEMHTAGPKRDFDWRLDCPERAYAAGFRRLGVGALFGLHDWREEALALAAHVDYLLKHCWKAQIAVSLPRLRPAAGGFAPASLISDRELVQLLCAFRVTFPQVGLVLSTREAADLRDVLIPLGVTMMSAGSHTEPGGYTGAGRADLHRTVRGRRVDAEATDLVGGVLAEGQFDIADRRSPREVAATLRKRHGLEAVWKDWDEALAGDGAVGRTNE